MYDVVIIGSGAGGASFARGAVARGLSVCILERGREDAFPTSPDPSASGMFLSRPEDRYNESVAGELAGEMYLHEGVTVGGSTVSFSGNLLRFHPQDFRRRTTLGAIDGATIEDWPIDYEVIAPYYDRIEQEVGVGGDHHANPFEPAHARAYRAPAMKPDRAGELLAQAARRLGWHPYPIPSIISEANGRRPCIQCGLCTTFPCTVDARWNARAMIAEARALGRVELVTSARATRILTDEAGDRARAVEYRKDGALHVVEGRAIVVAANAVQTPALLLASTSSAHPHGLANDSGLVGRNLMTHVHCKMEVGGLLPAGIETYRSSGCKVAIQDFYAREGRLAFTIEPRALGSWAMWEALATEQIAELGEAQVRARFLGNLWSVIIVEDLPQLDNRVTLSSTQRDRDGLPMAETRYVPHALDLEAADFSAARTRELLAEAGAEHLFTAGSQGPRWHVFGTCRMHADPSRGVVDADGRSHRVRNLVVADASVFTSSAGVNPALTVLALARRAADRLADAFQRREV